MVIVLDTFIQAGVVMLMLTGVATFLFMFTRTGETIETKIVEPIPAEPLITSDTVSTIVYIVATALAIAGARFIIKAYFSNKANAYRNKWENVFKPILALQTKDEGIKRLILQIELAIMDKNTLALDKYEGDLIPELLALSKCKELEWQVGEAELAQVQDKAIQSIKEYVAETEQVLTKQLNIEKEHLDLVSSRRNNTESYLAPLPVATVITIDTPQPDCSSTNKVDSNCSI